VFDVVKRPRGVGQRRSAMRSDFVRKIKEDKTTVEKYDVVLTVVWWALLQKKLVRIENQKGGPFKEVYRTRDKSKVSKSNASRHHKFTIV